MRFFVYGTLTERATAAAVLDAFEYAGAATLHGLRPVDGRYPTLAPGGETAGRLLETADVDALDRYEGVDRGLYVRVPVPRGGRDSDADTGDGSTDDGPVHVYVGDPDRLDAPASWPGDGPLRERVRASVDERAVRVTVDR